MRLKFYITLLLSGMFVYAFSYTNSYADMYGFHVLTPSAIAIDISARTGNNIDLLKQISLMYTFEMNANPRYSSVLTAGFSIYRTFFDMFPTQFKYNSSGINYNLSAKLMGIHFGNSHSELILGFAGCVGFNLESVSLLVGASTDYDDFNKVDFKHYNTLSNFNLLGNIGAYVEIPSGSTNFPSIMYVLTYGVGITLYGPFLPDFTTVPVSQSKVFNTFNHSFLLKVKF
ncbi:MAG: hypothetical protein ACP5PP_02165 [Fervidobacterium sp.]